MSLRNRVTSAAVLTLGVAVARALPVEPNARVTAPHETVKGGAEAEVVGAAMHPVLETATRHARSAIVIEIARDGRDVVASVTNDGAEICRRHGAHLHSWRQRHRGRRPRATLARRLARAAGGELTAVAPGPRFELRLPTG